MRKVASTFVRVCLDPEIVGLALLIAFVALLDKH